MNHRLSNKVAFITGGGSWIGKAIATVFAREGAKVFIVGLDEKQLAHTAQTIEQKGGVVSYAVADVRHEKRVQEVTDQALSRYGKIDILIQNAGIYPSVMLDQMTLPDWQQVIDVNLTGTFIILKALSTILKQQHSGRIVFISSITGNETSYPGYAHYAASKAGMNGLMRTAALELAAHHITVNSIGPGNIFNEERLVASASERETMLKAIPLRRLGKPLDVANLALFLASDESSFITGQHFVIDGGETIV